MLTSSDGCSNRGYPDPGYHEASESYDTGTLAEVDTSSQAAELVLYLPLRLSSASQYLFDHATGHCICQQAWPQGASAPLNLV